MALASLARLFRFRAHALQPQEAYELWAENYPPWPHNPLMQAEQSVMLPIINAAKPRRALDVGTGTGRYLPLLRAAGAHAVGADLSLAMLSQKAFGAPRVCANACRLPFADGRFDLVSSSLMAGDVEDLSAWLGEASRVLACGGHLVYSDFHPSWRDERWRRTFRAADGRLVELDYHAHTMDDHLDRLEQAGLDVRTIREPRVQAGTAPVVVVFHAVKSR